MKYIQLTWENWNKICDFTKPWFITGVYLNNKTKQPINQPYEDDGVTLSTDTIGLYLKQNGKICLVKQGDYIIKENNTLKIVNEKQFQRKQKLEKIKQINGY